jgi:DNA-binding transcriptional LysR family regulator
MSVKARYIWIIPAALVASWLTVRSLAAFPAYELEDPQLSMASASNEIADPALTTLISRFAAQARERN